MLYPGKKLVYFVRHGESENNAANLRQGAKGGLSQKGKEQAEFVGERLENVSIDVLLVSPYERAQETAGIINEILHSPVESLDLLVERKNPSEVIGKDADSPEVKKIMDLIDRSFHESDFRYSDEENFSDLKARARKVLDFVSKRKEQRIMCVSHRIFLKMIFAYMLQGEALDSNAFTVLDFNTRVENTAITVTEYNYWRGLIGRNPWKILAVNDSGKVVEDPFSVL
jgi:broad specificity phosphatase PhoE